MFVFWLPACRDIADDGTPVWIVQNQWSEYWGLYGTMLLPMDMDCGALQITPMVWFSKSQLPPGTKLRHVGEWCMDVGFGMLMF